jgi:hypothetical protein
MRATTAINQKALALLSDGQLEVLQQEVRDLLKTTRKFERDFAEMLSRQMMLLAVEAHLRVRPALIRRL